MSGIPIPSEPGLIILFGSGETSPTGRKAFDQVFHSLPHSPRLALLETPSGFELNSHQVISRVGDFFQRRLQNYGPRVEIIPACKRGTPFSPDEPAIVEPLLQADLIFMGPGSPSYAIRQLHDSLAWNYLIARHRLGAVLALASAATVAISACALPVYEIYKAGEELHWLTGLDFFSLYGLQLVFVPHWNNREGGAELDTSRCFMGQERFFHLMEMLPEEMTVVGLDEKTALMMDPSRSECQVRGLGSVTLIHTGHKHPEKLGIQSASGSTEAMTCTDARLATLARQRGGHIHQYSTGNSFSMNEIGHFRPYHPEASLPQGIWQKAILAASCADSGIQPKPPEDVVLLIQQRELARQSGAWAAADGLRRQIISLGWEILDTRNGPVSKKLS